MFKPGNLVQPRMDGPKLEVVEVNDDQIVVMQTNNESGDKFMLKATDVTRYTEEGGFGVC